GNYLWQHVRLWLAPPIAAASSDPHRMSSRPPRSGEPGPNPPHRRRPGVHRRYALLHVPAAALLVSLSNHEGVAPRAAASVRQASWFDKLTMRPSQPHRPLIRHSGTFSWGFEAIPTPSAVMAGLDPATQKAPQLEQRSCRRHTRL